MELHDHDAERALLGLITRLSLRSPEMARSTALGLGLPPEDFERPGHAHLWRAFAAILARGHGLEQLGVLDEVEAAGGKVPAVAVMEAMECARAFAASEAAPLARRIRELATRRRLMDAADALRAAAMDAGQPPDATALEASSRLATLGGSGVESTGTLHDSLLSYLERLDAIAKGETPNCVPTGIEVWDEHIGGLQAGVLTFIGAQPGVGKSALVGTMLRNIATAGTPVGLFSLEDDPEWLAERGLSWESGVPVHRLSRAKLFHGEGADVQNGGARLAEWAARLRQDGRSGLTAMQVAATARQWIAQEGVRAIVVDHLGELDLQAGKHDRYDLAVSAAVRELRDVAKDTGVPVVVCAHFARPPKSNEEPRHIRPTSASWANSSGVERMARVAVGLWVDPEGGDGEVTATVLKQTRGDKDFDFTMLLHKPSGLIRNTGGKRREGNATGYHETKRLPPGGQS
jgi:replicative DNA helicase